MHLNWLPLSRRPLLYSETRNNPTCCHPNILRTCVQRRSDACRVQPPSHQHLASAQQTLSQRRIRPPPPTAHSTADTTRTRHSVVVAGCPAPDARGPCLGPGPVPWVEPVQGAVGQQAQAPGHRHAGQQAGAQCSSIVAPQGLVLQGLVIEHPSEAKHTLSQEADHRGSTGRNGVLKRPSGRRGQAEVQGMACTQAEAPA